MPETPNVLVIRPGGPLVAVRAPTEPNGRIDSAWLAETIGANVWSFIRLGPSTVGLCDDNGHPRGRDVSVRLSTRLYSTSEPWPIAGPLVIAGREPDPSGYPRAMTADERRSFRVLRLEGTEARILQPAGPHPRAGER